MAEMLYGHHAVREALRAGRRQVHEIMVAHGIKMREDVADILRLAQKKRVGVRQVEREELAKLGSEARRWGVAARVTDYPYVEWAEIVQAARASGELPLFLLLDHVQDPQNLGTLLRTAEAVGVHGVAIPQRRAAGITPAVSNASAGAVEHLRVAEITNVAQTIAALKQQGVWIVGLEKSPEAKLYHQVDLNIPLALVVGSEGKGLSRLVRERCDLLIALPMRGRIGSLNASVAGSIALYWVWRQRDTKRGILI